MKKIVFYSLFAALLLACDKDSETLADTTQNTEISAYLTQIRIKERPNEMLQYVGEIGNDFDSALDSLIRKYEPILNTLAKEGHYSGEGYNINKEKINVEFSYDSREFILLTFTDKVNVYQILFSGDVIDEKGNYYRLIERPD
jgi:hypothetical protein